MDNTLYKKEIIICGAGGFAREIVSLMKDDVSVIFAGYLSDDNKQIGQKYLDLPVLNNIEDFNNKSKYLYVCGVGSPDVKKQFVHRLGAVDFAILNPYSIISNHITYGLDNTIEEGSIICSGSSITTNVKIGKHVAINLNCTIGHDVVIGNFVTIAPGCNISGNVTIGDGTELGTNVIVLPKISIGKNCVIGAGAVVNRDIPDNSVAVGLPAKVIKERIIKE